MKITLLIFAFAFCGLQNVLAQDGSEEFEGKLIQKSWAKSGQSYCAQGSAYYVLKTENETLVLQFDEDKFASKLKKCKDKMVKIRGMKITKRIPHPKNPMMQRPVTTDIDGNELDYYECEVFEVIEIN